MEIFYRIICQIPHLSITNPSFPKIRSSLRSRHVLVLDPSTFFPPPLPFSFPPSHPCHSEEGEKCAITTKRRRRKKGSNFPTPPCIKRGKKFERNSVSFFGGKKAHGKMSALKSPPGKNTYLSQERSVRYFCGKNRFRYHPKNIQSSPHFFSKWQIPQNH